MYYKGYGVQCDEIQAVEWIEKAAEQGHEMAIEALKSIMISRKE